MKKLIALISAIAVMGSMSLTSLAAITATPAENATLAAVEGGYSAALTTAATNTQTTILAVKGAEITTSSIQYINQLTQDSETAINFALKDALAVGETVNVYMGGDAIDKTLVGTIANVADPVEKFTVTFYDEDGTTSLQTAEYESGATLTAPANPTKAADASYTYTFAGWAVKGTTDVVTLPETVTAAAEYVAVYTATPVVTQKYYLGDVDGNSKITLADYNQVLLKVKRKTPDYPVGDKFTTSSGTEFMLGDVDGNNKITLADYNQILLKVKRKTPDYPVGEEIK